MGETSERNAAGEDIALAAPHSRPPHGDDAAAETRPSPPPSPSPALSPATTSDGHESDSPARADTPRRSEAGAAASAADAPTAVAPPARLRAWRALTSLIVLALAWVALTAAFLLAQNVWASASAHPHPLPRVLLYGVEVLASLWLGIAGIACIVTGAFCLMLALTRRGW